MRRRTLRSDERGLSTVEYVIVLVVVGLVGIAAWRSMGSQTASRAMEGSQEVSSLEQGVDSPASGSGSRATPGEEPGRGRHRRGGPAPSAQEELFGPVLLLGGAAILVLALVARRMLRKGDGGGQGGNGATT
ncbi:MAG: hypothetical protein IPF99_02765 [Deltaproteobacteria bacterium]|nr:hypothetical protein [Deltaproteobacteria bacterium]